MDLSIRMISAIAIMITIAISLFGILVIKNVYSVNLYEQGQYLVDHQRYEEAIPILRKSITFNANNGFVHNCLGIALAEQGNVDEAIIEYRRAIALTSPGYQATHYYLGNVLDKKHLREVARREWTLALKGSDQSLAQRAREQLSH